MNVFNDQIMTNVVLSANRTSPAVSVVNMFGFAIQAVITGTPTGTLKLQASVDPFKYSNAVQPPVNATHWVDIADSSSAVSTAGITIWNVNGVFFNFVRLVYTDGSSGASTAVLNVIINGKGA